MTDTGLIDGSWELTITVTDLAVEKTLRVKGDLHIGGVMLKLVEALGEYSTTLTTWPSCLLTSSVYTGNISAKYHVTNKRLDSQ